MPTKKSQEHEDLIQSATHIRRKLCCYDPNDPKLHKPSMCDCKFGVHKKLIETHGEVTGCAEMRSVEAILNLMTPIEWNRIQKRLEKKIKVTWKKLKQTPNKRI